MYILIDKSLKIAYAGVDLGIISERSKKSIYTLRSWNKKSMWYENLDYLLIEVDLLRSNRGGLNSGNEKYFRK